MVKVAIFTQLIGKNESKSSLLHCLLNKQLCPDKDNNIIICHRKAKMEDQSIDSVSFASHLWECI